MKITLGTVQFGINYGISNTHGVPSDAELKAILSAAEEAGIQQLDTAQAYGNAEERLGQFSEGRFQVITKFPAVATREELENALSYSLSRLNSSSVYGYLAHNAAVLIEKPFLWEVLQKAKEEKTIAKIGFSLYHPEQLEQLLELQCIPDLVQLPYSILDRKFEDSLSILKKIGTEIHVRSVFLQGLYFMDPDRLPEKLQPLRPALMELQAICRGKNISVGDAALNYAVSNPNIDQIVMGVETAGQLQENIRMVSSWKRDAELFSRIEAIEIKDKSLLNPVNW
ncbi:aldo/keto reductase [Flavobacterium humi]|uniref:aldo/keto reductase n=1 Tax=Flavobacterium humi TaxID=2562683 RepID=UPI00146B372A|nr:aldo/keto reductase [Flavobacterium humi]